MAVQNAENGVVWAVRGHSGSATMSSFDRAHTTSYSTLIETTRLFCTVLEIYPVNNDMQINISKTKEIVLGRISQDNLELLSTPAGTVERVTTFKLLGIHLDDTLTWSTHVNAITSKATTTTTTTV